MANDIDSHVTAVYVIANALHCDRITRGQSLHVLRTHDVPDLLSTMRSVAGATGMALHVKTEVARADLKSPAHVIVVTGQVDGGHARRIVEAMDRLDEGVSLFVILDDAKSRQQMNEIGNAMIEAGLITADEELEPRQQVPSALV